VILASGLKYVGLGTNALGWTLVGVLAAAFVAWMVIAQPWQKLRETEKPSDSDEELISQHVSGL
jgi:hypothetical protein